MRLLIFCFTVIVLSVRRVLAGKTYSKSVDITGAAFYDEFSFFSSADPTHGRVTYVDRQTAQEFNITYATDHSFVLGADHKTYLVPSDPGRRSARIISNRQLSTFVAVYVRRILLRVFHTHVFLALTCITCRKDVGEQPCNILQGEIDLVEGVNNMSPNIASLHTGTSEKTNLRPPSSINSPIRLRIAGVNCAAAETGNDGCGVQFSDKASFGPEFNSIGGGWYVCTLDSRKGADSHHRYALERNNSQIRAWFWPRTDGQVPDEVKSGSAHDIIDTDEWGMPAADWSSDECDFSKRFGPHRIVINLTFCGDWAGAVYSSSGCPDTCENYVNTNPGSFSSAYFEFSAIRIYA
ncbi:glycoside hydrolase family 16 protein [Chiua virens]|nr:glycoside hydrolase family 16 protein [Chiua virens]